MKLYVRLFGSTEQSRTASLFAPHPSRKRRCHPAELQMSSSRDREPTRGGATLVAPATGVAAAGGPDPPHPAHHDGVAPVTSCRRGVAPGHAAWALQPLEKTARRKNATGWHRFCLLSSGDSAAGTDRQGRRRRRGAGNAGGWEPLWGSRPSDPEQLLAHGRGKGSDC